MAEQIVYSLSGSPVAWARAVPRKHHMWDSQKNIKLLYGIAVAGQHVGEMYKGPLLLDVTFYFAMPKSRKREWDKLRNTPHDIKPDNSNCIKLLEDAITGVLIHDDCIIAEIRAKKVWADEGKTIFTIVPL